MKKVIAMVLVIAATCSLWLAALAAPSPVVGTIRFEGAPAEVENVAVSDLTDENEKAKLNEEMDAYIEANEVAGVPILMSEIKLADADGSDVEGEATVSLQVENLTEDSVVTVLCYKDGEWIVLESEIVDGMVKFTAEFPALISIIVDSEPGAESPSTGSTNTYTIIGLIIACVVLASIALFANKKRMAEF